MREIKFRAWHIKSSQMATWDDIVEIDTTGFYPFLDMVSSDLYRVMQYTGLKDRNGKEIYEGDIIAIECDCDPGDYAVCHHDPYNVYVDWDQETASYQLRSIDGKWSGEEFEDDMSDLWTIIGNIYENPELLISALEGQRDD